MATDFEVNIDVDISEAEAKIKELCKDKKIKIGVELDKSAEMQAKDLAKSIEKGLKSAKLDTSDFAKQIANSFNISDKNVIGNLKKQMDSMLTGLSKTWDGKKLDLSKATGFMDGLDKMAQTVSQNAKIVQSKMGIYDQFANYFKDKKIFISDGLKSAMGQDLYKEISNLNIGKIVRDATKGISIDSIWDEMTDLFPEHFSKDVTNQVDQIVKAFDVLKAARADVAKSVSFADMTPDQQFKITGDVYENITATAHKMVDSLKTNITSAADSLKTEFEIDVKVNTDNIISDIKNALSQAGANSGEAVKVNLDINQSEIETQIRNAIQSISSSDTPVDIKLDVSRQSLEADLQAALHDIDLPVQFRVDASDIENQIRAAVASIDDIQIDVHINMDSVRDEIRQQFNQNPVQIPVQTDNNTTGSIRNMNRAAQEGQTIFSALGGSVREAFQTFTLANLMEDGIYKVINAGKQGIETVKSLDDAMLDLQMATGESKTNVQNMMQGYNALGQELGALTTEVSSSADTWLRQGRSIEETNKLIKNSMVLSKVGQISSDQSSEILTATLNGFQMAADQAEHINDVLSSIDIASASSVEGIGTALTKTASMANNAGISLEKTAAMIATIKDVTQDSDSSIGTSINSILSRLNNIKSSKFVDSETGEALNDVEKVLGKIGISMRDANNQFLDSETIIDNVAAKWNMFDKTTQRAVATAMAGTRNYNKLVAMFDNYDKVQKLTAIANNSEGAAEAKFANYTESLQAKTKSLQASLEALASDTLSSEMYAGFLDAAKGMADFAKETDLVKTALAGLGTAGATYAFTQLSTMLSNTITQVANLGGGLRALWGVLSAHPVALVTAGVTAAVGVWNAYRASVDEAVNSAKQAGDTWEQSNTSIQDNISRITELRNALDSGKLTEQEAYDTKSQLLDIQNQLSESYGSQAEGIDLVNGSLDEQIAKLKELNIAQSERFLNENQKGIEEAQRQMEKERHTYLGQFSPYAQDADKLQSIIDKYKDRGVYTDTDMDGTVYIHFKGDATDANTVLNDIMTDLRAAADETGNTNLFDGFIQNAAAGLNEAKDVLDEYQKMYNQAMKADIQSNKKDYGGKTAVEWLNNYAKAVENYNNAVASGNVQEVESARKYYNAISDSINALLKGSDMSQYNALFTDVPNQLDKAAIKANEFNSALNVDSEQYQYLNGYQKKIKAVADEVKNLDMSDIDFKAAVNSGDIDSINFLSKSAQEAGISTDDLAQALVNLGVLSGQPSAAMEEIADSFQSVSDSANTLISHINAVNSVLSSQSTGKSISIKDFNSDELKDYTSALEYNNGALQLNAEKVRELQKAKSEEAIQTNENQKLEKQSQYMKNIAEIEKLQDELRKLSDAKSENAQAIQNSIDALLSENDGLVNQCDQLDILSASLREATGAYQNWLDKQNTSESGDMFDDAMGALDHIEDTVQNTKSEYYGRTGRESYKAAVEFLVPDTIDGQDAEAVSSYIDSIEHYFNHDSKGNRTGLDVAEFCAKATKAGLMELDKATNEYKILGQRTMEDFAEGLNLSLPMVQAMFGEMEEFNAEFDWSDEAVKTLGDMAMAAGEAKGRIEELSGDKNLDIQIDVSDIDSTEDKISTLENTISQMQDYKSTLEVDSSQVNDANAIIQYCVTQKQMLEAPAVMSVDTSQVDGEIGNALSLLQQFQEAQNNVELQAAVGADTSEAQGKVDSLVSEIQGLSPEIKAQLGLDDSTSATITASIQALTPPELKVRAGVDATEVNAYAAQEKQSNGTVTWGNDTGKVDAWAAQMHVSNGTVTWGNDITRVKTSFTATGTVNWTNTTPPSGGTHGLNGTAHASGTAQYPHLVGHANAKGNWGTKTGGMTLVGELGREIVVNPYTGTWQTVGDNGAEFKYIPAGSIVFNHLQTESLLERGFVNSRGTARASGTAMVTGGIPVKQANIASKKDTYKGSSSNNNTKAQDQNTSATNDNTTSKQENTKATKESTEAMNWVERGLNKLSKVFERYANQINDYISSSLKVSLLKKQLSTIDKQLEANQKGYDAYMEKANSINISDEYKDLVKNGAFRIEEIDTSTDAGKKLAEDIKKFQDYYDSAMDCKDAIIELNNKQLELYDTLAKMPTEKAEKKIEKLKRKYESLSAVSDAISSGGSVINALTKQINEDNPKLANAQANVTKAETARTKTKATRSTASRALKAAKEDTEKSGTSLVNAAKKQTSNYAKNLKKAAKSSTDKATYNAIAKAIREGKPVSTKGLKGEALKYAKSYNSSLKQQNTVTKAVNSGKKVNTSGMSKVLKAEAAQYNQDVKAQTEAQKAYDKAREADKKALEKLNKAKATKDEVYSQTTKEQQTLATNKSPKAYVVQNKLLDQELAILKAENTARQTALKEITAETKKQQAEYDKAVASRNKNAKSLLSNKSVTSALNKTQLAALKAGKTVSTKGITDPAVLKKIEAYNKKVSNASDLNKKLNIQLEAQADAVNNAAQAEAEYAQMLVDNEKKKLENISNYYDSMMAQFETKNSLIQTYMNRMETRGYNLSTSFYEAQIANQKQIANKQKAELAAMQKSFQEALNDGTIQVGTQDYYEMKDIIDQLTLSIAETTNNIVELQASIRDLEWEQFDRLQESIKRVASESDFLIELMSSKELYDKKTGLLTDEGWATMGLHGVNYNTYMAQADKYKEEMLRINAELASDPNNQKLIDRKNELIDAQQQSILAAENEKKSIRDMVENGIDMELDAIDDLIDKYLDAIKQKKNLLEYEKKIQKQAESVASLQKQLAAYQNDNSEEAKAKIQEIKVNLKDAQDDLKEAEYDKFISDQEELLESLRNDYEEVLNKRLDNIDVLIQTSIDQINANAENIQATLTEQAKNVGYELSTEMTTIWEHTDGVTGAISTYDGHFTSTMTGVSTALGNIYERQRNMIDAINAMAEKYIQKVEDLTKPQTPIGSVLEEVVEDNTDDDDSDVGNDSIINNSVVGKVEPSNPKNNSAGGATLSGGTSSGSGGNKNNTTSGGDGKAKVGDKVTFANGKYYGASDGTSGSGNSNLNKSVYITRISSGSAYPYHISTGSKFGSGDLGWVKLNQLKGYVSGGHVDKDQWAFVNENGQELIRYNGATLLPLPGGADIWNAPETKALLDKMSNPQPLYYDYTSQLLKKLESVGGNGSGQSDMTHIDTLNVSLPNVTDPEDFIDFLIKSKRFERLIDTMTVDRMTGRATRVSKYHCLR